MKRAAQLFALFLPMLAAAQLPMLLDYGKAQIIGIPPNPAFVGYYNDVTYFYGDSVTYGYDPNNPNGPPLTNRFSTLLSTQFSLIESNQGVGGSQIADPGESDRITANNAIYATNISVWLAGYNDMFYYGTNAAALDDNATALASLAAWLAIPTSQRVPWNSTNIFYTANYQHFLPDTLGGLAYSDLAGAYASFYFSGSTLLIGAARGGGSGNVILTVGDVVDGVPIFPAYLTNTYSCLRASANTAAGRSYSAGLIIVTNLSSTTNHYAFFTAQSSAFTFFSWYAAYATNQLPKVVLAGTLKPAGGIYLNSALPPNFQNGSDLAADQYSGMISNVAAMLAVAKLNVKWVPAPLLNSNTDYEFDGIHPDDSGHLKIKNAIQAAF